GATPNTQPDEEKDVFGSAWDPVCLVGRCNLCCNYYATFFDPRAATSLRAVPSREGHAEILRVEKGGSAVDTVD
ncbi:MAG: hypothetical protein JSV16_16995, partial [Candidatus Hydrogenedentota bacterium]